MENSELLVLGRVLLCRIQVTRGGDAIRCHHLNSYQLQVIFMRKITIFWEMV